MKRIAFMLGGTAMVVIAFFLPGKQFELWPNIISGGIAGIVYIVLLMLFNLRAPFAPRTRLVAAVAGLCLIAGGVVTARYSYLTSHYSRSGLPVISRRINHGVMVAELDETLLKTLDTCYNYSSGSSPSLKTAFLHHFPNAAVGSEIQHQINPALFSVEPDTAMVVYVTALSDSSIQLVTEAAYAWGSDRQYKNYNGWTGKPQQTATLTMEGVRDVIDN